ncbi:Flp family type IVb pilin [Salmonella enterica]|nr:Flp family type IVb pilin [Salmonella enterica subsp. enterica serovar Hadar]
MSENLMLKGYVIGRIIAESISSKCKNYLRKNDGVTAVEYAIVVAGVAAIVLAVFGTTGPVQTMLNDTFTNLKTQVSNLIGGGGKP